MHTRVTEGAGCRPRFSRLATSPLDRLDALSRAWLTEEKRETTRSLLVISACVVYTKTIIHLRVRESGGDIFAEPRSGEGNNGTTFTDTEVNNYLRCAG